MVSKFSSNGVRKHTGKPGSTGFPLFQGWRLFAVKRHLPFPCVRLLVGVSAVLLVASCGPKTVNTMPRGERRLVEASADRVPDWITREPASDAEYHYFRGIRTDAPSLEAGETDARQNALASIVQFLGLRVTVDYQRLRTEEQTRIADAIRSVGGADLFGTRLSEMFYRRWRVIDGGEVHDKYDVYLIVRFPRESVDRIKTNQQERLQAISRLVGNPAGEPSDPSGFYAQISSISQALRALTDLNQSVLITTETEGQAQQLKALATTKLLRLVGSARLSLTPPAARIATGRHNPPLVFSCLATNDRGVPIPNLPLRLSVGDSSQVVWSNASGVAEVIRSEIHSTNGRFLFSAQLDLPVDVRSLPDIARTVPSVSSSLEVVPRTETIRLLVVVDEWHNRRSPSRRTAEERLIAALRERGFTVVSAAEFPRNEIGNPWSNQSDAFDLARKSHSDFLVWGSVETGEATLVPYSTSLYATSATAQIRAIDAVSQNVMATVVLPDGVMRDTRGFGNTPERAAEEAVTLARRDFPNGYAYLAEQLERALTQ